MTETVTPPLEKFPEVFVWDNVGGAFIEGGRLFVSPGSPEDEGYDLQPGDVWFPAQLDSLYITIPADRASGFTISADDIFSSIGVDTAGNVTIPPNATVPIPVGAHFEIRQKTAGQVVFVEGAGVVINSRGNAKKIAGQYGAASALKVDLDVWSLQGDISV